VHESQLNLECRIWSHSDMHQWKHQVFRSCSIHDWQKRECYCVSICASGRSAEDSQIKWTFIYSYRKRREKKRKKEMNLLSNLAFNISDILAVCDCNFWCHRCIDIDHMRYTIAALQMCFLFRRQTCDPPRFYVVSLPQTRALNWWIIVIIITLVVTGIDLELRIPAADDNTGDHSSKRQTGIPGDSAFTRFQFTRSFRC